MARALPGRLVRTIPDRWTASLGACAEAVAAELGIGRAEQDEWALRSHERAAAAWDAGAHDGFAFDVDTPSGVVKRDESIRADTTAEKLAGLRPAFTPGGTVTATIANGPGYLLDWVGVNGTGDADTSYQSWRYLSGTQTPPASPLSNTSFDVTMPSTPGTFNAAPSRAEAMYEPEIFGRGAAATIVVLPGQ